MLGRHSIKCSSCPLLHMQPLLQPVSQMKVSVSSYSFPVCIQPCITHYRNAVVWGFDMVGSAGYECGPPWHPEIQESDTWGLVCWTGFLARPCLESCDFILIPQIVCMRNLWVRIHSKSLLRKLLVPEKLALASENQMAPRSINCVWNTLEFTERTCL